MSVRTSLTLGVLVAWGSFALGQESPRGGQTITLSDPLVVLQEQAATPQEAQGTEEAAAEPAPQAGEAAAAQAAAAAAAPNYGGPLWSRSTLTGDWGGWRSVWQERGIAFA